MNTLEMLKARKEEIAALALKHGAYNIRVFGSAVRGEETQDSDIDFLVDMEQGRTLLDHSGLVLDLQELLGCKVDVVTEHSLYWILWRKVMREGSGVMKEQKIDKSANLRDTNGRRMNLPEAVYQFLEYHLPGLDTSGPGLLLY